MRILLLSLFLLTTPAWAGDGEVVTLRKGQAAPFDGTLISPEVAAKIITDAAHADEVCAIETKRQLDIQEAQLTLKTDIADAALKSCQERSKMLAEIHAEELGFYKEQLSLHEKQKTTPWFVGGLIGGVGLTLASAWAVSLVN